MIGWRDPRGLAGRRPGRSDPRPDGEAAGPAWRRLARRLLAARAGWRGWLLRLLPDSPWQLVVTLHDLAMAALSFALAVVLRFGVSDLTPERLAALYQGMPLFAVVALGSFLAFGVYRGVWRFASIGELLTIMKASTLAILVFFVVTFTVDRLENVPRSVPVIQWFVLIVMVGGPRFAFRLLCRYRRGADADGLAAPAAIPVLVIGAGEGASLLIRALEHDPQPLYRVTGLVSRKPGERGRRVLGAPVLGHLAELGRLLSELERRGRRPQRLIVTVELDGEAMRALVAEAERYKLLVSRLPSLTEFRQATGDGRLELRPVAIEDLLGRPQALLDEAAIGALIEGRRVLVTGAGGSIGSELVRQIARRRPARLVLVDNGEYNLYAIDHEIAAAHPDLPRAALLADVRDRERVMRLFSAERPELVFHAAALKHVPLVELNPAEGLRTNVLGTRNVADAAQAHGVLAMVQVSTDKAVNPTSVMGASKRLGELYCQALDLAAPERELLTLERGPRPAHRPPTRFMTVRFGNVLGSSGSVVPLFQKQLEQGGPLTVTHPDITRYFMTIREAVELVLQASAHGLRRDDERGQIFVLDMGEPVRIIDVARQMIRLAGLEPERDVKIQIVGLRPGEKLYEELFDASERRLPAVVPGVLVAASRVVELERLRRAFAELEAGCATGEAAGVRKLVAGLIPGYAAAGEESAAA